MAYIAGKTYNTRWLTNFAFSHLAINLSKLFKEIDLTIIFKFNHIEELYEIEKFKNFQIQTRISSPTINASLDNLAYNFGDCIYDNTAKALTLFMPQTQTLQNNNLSEYGQMLLNGLIEYCLRKASMWQFLAHI